MTSSFPVRAQPISERAFPSLWLSVHAELTILSRQKLVAVALVVACAYQVYSLYEASQWRRADDAAGYYLNQSLVSLVQLSGLSLMVVLAGAGSREDEWGTTAPRVAVEGRMLVLGAKVFVSTALTVGVVAACGALGLVVDAVAGDSAEPVWSIVRASMLVFLVVECWSLVTLLLALLMRKPLPVIVIIASWYLIEASVDALMPQGVVSLLPVENARAILSVALPARDGFIAVPPALVTSFGGGCGYYGSLLLVVSALLWLVSQRRSL